MLQMRHIRLCHLSLLTLSGQFVSLDDFETALGRPQSACDVLSLPLVLLRFGAFRGNLSIACVGFSTPSPVLLQTWSHLVPGRHASRCCTNRLLCSQERLDILGKPLLLLTPRL